MIRVTMILSEDEESAEAAIYRRLDVQLPVVPIVGAVFISAAFYEYVVTRTTFFFDGRIEVEATGI